MAVFSEQFLFIYNDCFSHYHLPDFFSVHIPNDDDEQASSKRVIVEIISKPIVKPYLGGFINKRKGKLLHHLRSYGISVLFSYFCSISEEYHDAFTQTGPVYEAIKWSGITSRECQAGQKDQCLVK